MNLDKILPELYVGSYPAGGGDIDRLKREFGITAVLNLQSDDDDDHLGLDWPTHERHYRRAKMTAVRVRIQDFDQDDLRTSLPACVRELSGLIHAGHTVYVHCTAGVNRSPSVVIGYLLWVREWGLDEAVEHVQRCHPCAPDVDAIVAADAQFDPNDQPK